MPDTDELDVHEIELWSRIVCPGSESYYYFGSRYLEHLEEANRDERAEDHRYAVAMTVEEIRHVMAGDMSDVSDDDTLDEWIRERAEHRAQRDEERTRECARLDAARAGRVVIGPKLRE